ncbi:hypothetical protein E2C01_039579 [Portunus trituberculatus]|uniref:Uncharacterized protein n=1 Tax=Portunus trituberculatus TaxID=210409 RepID=A0A5B7FL23_PORTR|nr:hypothetical protein [Portunus trituberculatus]
MLLKAEATSGCIYVVVCQTMSFNVNDLMRKGTQGERIGEARESGRSQGKRKEEKQWRNRSGRRRARGMSNAFDECHFADKKSSGAVKDLAKGPSTRGAATFLPSLNGEASLTEI